jgi:hypothetical protein
MPDERGEKGGVVMDGDDAGLTPIEGDNNEPGTEKDQEDNIVVDESGKATDPERGGTDKETPEDGGGEEGEVPEEGAEPRPKDDPRLSAVEKTLAEINEKIQKKEEPVKEKTPEEWAKLEEEWGAPRSVIERTTRQAVMVFNKMQEYVDSRFAKLEFGNALSDFSKQPGFSDANRYRKDVEEFLSDYDSKHWTNPKLIERAVFYARGKNAQAREQFARSGAERNRVIAGTARPASPGGGTKPRGIPPLRADQKEAAELMGGESEYRKYQRGGRVTIE